MNALKIWTVIITLSCVLFASCSEPLTVGSSEIIMESRAYTGFENIKIEGIFETQIRKAEEHGVTIIANANILQYINTKVNDKTLEITMAQRSFDNIEIEIIITSPDLREITKRGVGTTKVEGFYDLKDLEINHFGLASFSMEGSVDNLVLNKTGIGVFEAFDLITNSCEIEQDGIGDTQLTCNDSLTGELTGIGNIYFKGNPSIAVDVTGIGNVKDAN